jgi:aspartate/methionine/tyrosine aminotransferase
MTALRHGIRSAYMEWAKLHSHARYNLATSGLANLPLTRLSVRLEDLEITGAAGYGYEPLQRRIAEHCGVPVECVVPANGTSMANHLALAALLDPGDNILVEHPTYELLLTTAKFLGANVLRFPRRFEDDFRISISAIKRAMTPRTRLIALTNLHNPSSGRAEEAALRALGELARRDGVRVLVDEVYLETLYETPVPTSFHLGEQFVVTSSLTKAYGLSGLRCGWILASPELANRVWRLNDLFGVNAPHASERLSVIALDHLDEISRDARALLATNRALINQFLDSRPDLQAVRPVAGTTVFPRLLHGNVDRLCALLREKYETTVVPGSFFEMPDHFRLGLGGDTATLTEGLRRLAAALDEFSNSGHSHR